VRPQARYERSLELLARAAAWARSPELEGAPSGASRDAATPAVAHADAPLGADPFAPARAGRPARPLVKTGFMVGLGESALEVGEVLADAAAAGVDAVTIGQYLQPDAGCLPVGRYVTPEEFEGYERRGAALGLAVVAAPFVRSSYRAGELLKRGA
jgi:lipoate synthase